MAKPVTAAHRPRVGRQAGEASGTIIVSRHEELNAHPVPRRRFPEGTLGRVSPWGGSSRWIGLVAEGGATQRDLKESPGETSTRHIE